MSDRIEAVVFDIGKVLVEWDLALIYRDLIPDPAERDWFVSHVVTPEWHFQHDAGRPLAEIVPERIAAWPEHEALIQATLRRVGEEAIPLGRVVPRASDSEPQVRVRGAAWLWSADPP